MIDKKIHPAAPLFILVGCALFFQLTGHYFAGQWLRFGSFWGLWLLLRVALPLLVICLLGIPLARLFLGLPKFDRTSTIALVISLLVLAALYVYLNYFADDYLAHYRRGRSIEALREQNAFGRFMIFTLSTMTGWEFLHRAFLLGGILYCLKQYMDTPEKTAAVVAILIVCVFEVLFHIKKPMYESFSFIPASIFLSWLTLRTQSLWPAMLLHLAIEINFAFAAYL